MTNDFIQLEADTVRIEDIDREIASRSLRLRFTLLEDVFEKSLRLQRTRMFLISGSSALVLYDAFLMIDWIDMRDCFLTLVVGRLLVFTPILLLCLVYLYRRPNSSLAEPLGTFCTVLGAAVTMSAFAESHSPGRVIYQYGSLVLMLYATAVLRLRFRYLRLTVAAILAIQLVCTALNDAFTPPEYITNTTFFITAAILLCLASYLSELYERRSFLFVLRSSLLQKELERQSRTDALTGLFNRRRLQELATAPHDRGGAQGYGAVLLDVDMFKRFNDTYGHERGDECLRAVSACVRRSAQRHGGLAFRYGGEEMLVLLPGADSIEAARVAEEIRVMIESSAIAHSGNRGGVVTASFGVAVGGQGEIVEAIRSADAALYEAKGAGRNRVRVAAESTEPDESRLMLRA